MNFINPIELLGLSGIDPSNIDLNLIKKSKRKIQAEIELSEDNHIIYSGRELTISDAETVINELEEKEKLEFYHFIATNKPLNNFLTSRSDELFNNFRQEGIYKLPEFIKLISTHFAYQYDRISYSAFKDGNITRLKLIFSVTPLVTVEDLDKAFNSISNSIRNKIKEVELLTRQIRDEESIYTEDDIENVYNLITDKLDSEVLNTLPSYFQSLRNQAAQSIRNLSVNIFNTFGDSTLSMELLDYALDIEINGLIERNLFEDLEQITKLHKERIAQEKYVPIAKKYANILIGIKERLEKLNQRKINVSDVVLWVNANISAAELNKLGALFDGIRNQISFGLRGLSASIWNGYSDINSALSLIYTANEINVNPETRKNLIDAKNQLLELKQKLTTGYGTKKTDNSSDNGCLIILGIAVVIVIVISLANIGGNNSNTKSYRSESNHLIPDKSEINDNPEPPIIIESKFKGNQLKNGASPFDACFGKGVYGGHAILTIKNGSATDAIVCLYKTSAGRTVRNEYVRKNSQFEMSNISEGYYRIRVFFGNDWNPEKLNPCGTYGNFDSDVSFSEFDQTDYFQDNETQYTVATITLYSVVGGNASSSPINSSEFFNK